MLADGQNMLNDKMKKYKNGLYDLSYVKYS